MHYLVYKIHRIKMHSETVKYFFFLIHRLDPLFYLNTNNNSNRNRVRVLRLTWPIARPRPTQGNTKITSFHVPNGILTSTVIPLFLQANSPFLLTHPSECSKCSLINTLQYPTYPINNSDDIFLIPVGDKPSSRY